MKRSRRKMFETFIKCCTIPSFLARQTCCIGFAAGHCFSSIFDLLVFCCLTTLTDISTKSMQTPFNTFQHLSTHQLLKAVCMDFSKKYMVHDPPCISFSYLAIATPKQLIKITIFHQPSGPLRKPFTKVVLLARFSESITVINILTIKSAFDCKMPPKSTN